MLTRHTQRDQARTQANRNIYLLLSLIYLTGSNQLVGYKHQSGDAPLLLLTFIQQRLD
jgi:hypothetical protein